MVEARVVLEKVNVLENKMRYQMEQLVELAQSEQSSSNPVVDGDKSPQHDSLISDDLGKIHSLFALILRI